MGRRSRFSILEKAGGPESLRHARSIQRESASMGDQRDKWPEIPAWDRAVMAWPDLVVRSMGDLCQHLVSGDLDAFRTYASLPAPEVGALELANGSRYSARLARDRILVVGADERRLQPGWNKAGFAVTRAS